MNDLYQLENNFILYFHLLLWCLEPLAPRASHFDPEYHNEDNLLHFEVHVIHMLGYASVVFTRQIAEFSGLNGSYVLYSFTCSVFHLAHN